MEETAALEAPLMPSEGKPSPIPERAEEIEPVVIMAGRLRVNRIAHAVYVDGKPLRLTGREYGILELLARHEGIPVSKGALLNHLYGDMGEPSPGIINVFVCKLRKKLSAATSGNIYVETIWGRGHALRQLPNGADPAQAD